MQSGGTSSEHVDQTAKSGSAQAEHGDVHVTPRKRMPEGSGGQKMPNEGSQGGVLKKKKPQPKVNNTPLGIQPQQPFNKGDKVTTTTMGNIEAKRREMQAKLRNNPTWKI